MGPSRLETATTVAAHDQERHIARGDSHGKAVKGLQELQKRRSNETPKVCLTRYGEPLVSPRAWFELVMEEAVRQNHVLKTLHGTYSGTLTSLD